MYQPLEPLVMASQVEWEIVAPASAAMAGAIVALYRRVIVLSDRGREDTREIIPAVRDMTEAVKRLTEAVERQTEAVNDLVKRAS